ncbi:MAG: hypothetical protein PVS3B3_07410 [Ktedonobacteraceae bacterium]
MTRDFNKPKRDDSHPSFRNTSPNRNRDERSPRPARPRLNRETVDRAWESGAQQQHADYRPRTGGGPARPQGQRNGSWNNTPNRSGYSSQNGHNGSRPYSNNRQENFRDNRPGNYRDEQNRRDSRDTPRNFDRQQGATNDYRSARPSYGQERRDFGGQRFDDRRDSSNSPNRRSGDGRQQFQERGNQRRDFGHNDRPARNTNGTGPQRESSHPRWQSRPGEQHNSARGPEREFNRRSNGGEHFEGDYEHFEERHTRPTHPAERRFEGRDTRSQRPNSKPFEGRETHPPRAENRTFEGRDTRDTRPPRPAERPFSGSRSPQGKPERRFDTQKSETQPERHVTRLPDGRVLKGPRPVQRRNAQFWTGVTTDTSELVSRVQEGNPDKQTQEGPTNETFSDTPPENVAVEIPSGAASEVSEIPSTEGSVSTNELPHEVVSEATSTEEGIAEVTPQKRRTRTAASAVTRSKKPRSTGPKPSQRGFKWPTQE